MKLGAALKSLLDEPGVLAALLFTRDGLAVEMYGYGLRANELAAQAAGMAGAARRGCRSLGLGEPQVLRVGLKEHTLDIYPLGDYDVVVVSSLSAAPAEQAGPVAEKIGTLRLSLKGEA